MKLNEEGKKEGERYCRNGHYKERKVNKIKYEMLRVEEDSLLHLDDIVKLQRP